MSLESIIVKLQDTLVPTLGNSLTLVASAFVGALSIIIGRGVYRRRRSIAALHTELINNYIEIQNLQENLNEADGDPLDNFSTVTVENIAYEALKREDPGLFVKLDSYSNDLHSTYTFVDTIEKFSNYSFYKDLISMIEITQQPVTDGGEENYEVKDLLDEAEESTRTAVSDIEEYTTESYFRKIFYWRCFVPFKEQNVSGPD